MKRTAEPIPEATTPGLAPSFLAQFPPAYAMRIIQLVAEQACCCCTPEQVYHRVAGWLDQDLANQERIFAGTTDTPASKQRLEDEIKQHDGFTAHSDAALEYCRRVIDHRRRPRATKLEAA